MKTIYLAGGCFWGLQKFFDQFDGVIRTEVGYANGPDQAPTYEQVCRDSGHAETVRIDYDGDDRPVGILKEKGYGVFVTLHLDGRLRGCIGRFSSDETLHATIREMARSAAFSDPRFPSLSRNEVHRIDIEVSVLSPLKRIASIDEFKLGRDGIYMIKGSRHGTFLPQVADETGWSTEEFLGHCARDKAGIGWEGWKDADLYTYRTEVVKESEL